MTTRQRLILSLALLILAAPGCRSPEYKAARAERDERMRKTIAWQREYNARGPDNIRKVGALIETHERDHDENLRYTLQWIKDIDRRRSEKWTRDADRRNTFYRRMIKGDPDNIEPSFARIAY